MKSPRVALVVFGLAMLTASSFLTGSAFSKPPGPSIVDIALEVNAETGEFSTLIAALGTAGLVETLDGNRQFTVFAPVDEAFLDLGLDATNIVDLPVEELTNILLYHVSPGRRLSTDVLDSDRVRTLSKDFTYPSLAGDVPFINDAQIIDPDIEARNGVIHVVDGVLLPGFTPATVAIPEPASATLMGLGSLACLALTRRRRVRK